MEDTVEQGMQDQGVQGQGQSMQQNGNDWRSNLPQELQPVVSRFGDVESLVKSYREAQSVLGKKVETFGEQDWQSYQNIMSQLNNVPVSADQYQIDISPMTEGHTQISEEDSQTVLQLSHHLGLDNEQAQNFHDIIVNYANDLNSSVEQESAELFKSSITDLKEAWGNAADTKLRAVESAINNVLPGLCGTSADALKEELTNAQVYNSPSFMKILAAIGEMTMDSSSRGYNNMAPMDAQSRFNHMKNDPDFMKARIDPFHPRHEQAKKEFAAMCSAANGGL